MSYIKSLHCKKKGQNRRNTQAELLCSSFEKLQVYCSRAQLDLRIIATVRGFIIQGIHGPMHVLGGETLDELSGPVVRWISLEIHMDQWLSNLSESSGLNRYRSRECSCLTFEISTVNSVTRLVCLELFTVIWAIQGEQSHGVTNLLF